MTIETMSEPAGSGEDAAERSFVPGSDAASRSYVLASLGLLVVAVVGGLVTTVQLVAPEFLDGAAALSFGRLQPAATHVFVYGWITIGLLGALLYVLPRAMGRDLSSQIQAQGALGLLVLGYVGGAIGIAAGFSEGRRLLEAPLLADVVVLLGLLGVARVIIATARSSDDMGPVQWYSVAAVSWLVLLHVVGNIPGLGGVLSALQGSFYRAGLMGLWVAAAGVGVVYHLIPRLSGRRAFAATQMSVAGLWSLALLWIMTAPADLTYGPTPDWIDTVSVIFAIGMLVPIAVIFTDVVIAMRGRWGGIADSTTMHLVMAGAVSFALLPVINLAMALRSTSAVVGFTDWVAGYEFVAYGGAGTFWLLAFVSLVAPEFGRGTPAPRRLHYRFTLFGVVIVAGSLLAAGAQTGFIWLGAANSDAFANTGDGFRNTLEGIEGLYGLRLVGYAIFTLAIVWFVAGYAGKAKTGGQPAAGAAEPDVAVGIEPELALARPVGLARLAVTGVGLFAVAALIVLITPIFEGDLREPTLLADQYRDYDDGGPAADGRAVYLAEGCYVCHTQAVRPIVTDVGLGAVSVAGDYVHETPALIGSQRIGPDLMHVGGRSVEAAAAELAGADGDPAVFEDQAREQVAAFVRSHLRDPRDARPWSIMPSYDHLSDADLAALAQYIAALD